MLVRSPWEAYLGIGCNHSGINFTEKQVIGHWRPTEGRSNEVNSSPFPRFCLSSQTYFLGSFLVSCSFFLPLVEVEGLVDWVAVLVDSVCVPVEVSYKRTKSVCSLLPSGSTLMSCAPSSSNQQTCCISPSPPS